MRAQWCLRRVFHIGGHSQPRDAIIQPLLVSRGIILPFSFLSKDPLEGDLEVIWSNSYSDEEKPLSEKETFFSTSKWEGYFVTFYIL